MMQDCIEKQLMKEENDMNVHKDIIHKNNAGWHRKTQVTKGDNLNNMNSEIRS